MADENANRRRADIAAALAEPATASLARAGAAIVVAEGDPLRAVDANAEALALFGAADLPALTARLFESDELGTGRLLDLARNIAPGAPARLERLRLGGEAGCGSTTLLCRRTAGAAPLFVLATLGLRTGRRQPAPTVAVPAASEPAPEIVGDAGDANLAALKARLEGRFPGLAPARFLWRADSRNVIVELTPPLAEIVGPGCADLVGRDLVEAAATLGFDPRGELATALRARATFSRIDVDWPIESAAAAAPVTLGGLPVFDSTAHFDGWRGFGVIHLDRLRNGPLVAGLAPEPRQPSKDAPDAPAPVETVQPDFSGVVVPLRPLTQPSSLPTLVAPSVATAGRAAPRAEPEASVGGGEEGEEALVALSPHERSAFREIARALGARGPTGPAEGAADQAGAPDAPPPAPEPERAPAVDAGLFEAVPAGVVVLRGGEPLYANRLALDWLGHADLAAFAAAGGLRSACRFAAADLAAGQKRTLLLRAATGEAFSADAHCEKVDWNGRPAELVTLIRPSASALEQRIGVIEASLRQRESEIDEIQSMLEAASDGVALVNADGILLGLDKAAETLLDYDRNQVAGENFTLLLARESHVSALDYFARAKVGAEKRGREAIGRTRQGAAVPLHLTFGRLGPAADGKFCLILRDMSHWRQTERAMEEARGQAERDSRAKSEFLAKVSHEIRTPLNAILGFAEVIMDERFGPVGNERYKDYLRDIHASGSHVMSLVNDLLDLSKIEAGKLELSFAAVDANRIVSECVSMMQPQANREKVITRLALAARLPAIQADERSLRQIVLNILANAVRYNEPGGQVIVSTALTDSGHAALRVKDTGVGMTESELRTALEPFRQVAPAREGGTGLGLPLTKALAEANGASFSIRSRKNEGTLVEVVFPLAAGAVSAGGATG